ncbi:MAG: hypothetical protein WA726_07080 [Acidimicrobiia bacterium]
MNELRVVLGDATGERTLRNTFVISTAHDVVLITGDTPVPCTGDRGVMRTARA